MISRKDNFDRNIDCVTHCRTRTAEFIPCETCGYPTDMFGTKRCNNCWEVESRLNSYLHSTRGVENVLKIIASRMKGIEDD